MKKIDFGQTIAVLANLAVLASILLLAYELSLTRQAIRAETRSSVSDRLQGLALVRLTNPRLSQIVLKAESGDTLTEFEAEQYGTLIRAYFGYRQETYYQYRNGLYDEGEYHALRDNWKRILNGAPSPEREIWCSMRRGVTADFRFEIDELLDRPCE